ncbi:rhamnose binding lectin, partial [Triplophysa rosa]
QLSIIRFPFTMPTMEGQIRRCNGRNGCNLYISSLVYLDQCPHIYKYLKVFYTCEAPGEWMGGTSGAVAQGHHEVLICLWIHHVLRFASRIQNSFHQKASSICSSVCTFIMLHRELSFLTCVKAVDLITCEGETASFTCAQGTIKVLSANYGRTDRTTCSTGRPAKQLSNVQCTQSTSLSVLTTQCDGKPDCSVSVNNIVFGDPCVGTYKYLNVSYTCVPTIIICHDKSRTLTCEGHRQLHIHFANYGRRDEVTCPHSNASAMSSMCTSSQTRNLQLRCNGKGRCVLHASNSQFNHQCPHIHKYLEVSYSCD